MSMNKKQWEFALAVARLILFADAKGYRVRIAWAYRPSWVAEKFAKMGIGVKRSKHCDYLAVDLDLFDLNGKYLDKTEDHLLLGLEWERMGHTWGGRFSKPDGNHYEW